MLHDFTVFDFETTGTKARLDQVVEMAAVRYINGRQIFSWSTLVRLRPLQTYDPKAQEVNGITPADLVDAMKEKAAFEFLRKMIQGSLLVAHNAVFDLEFLDDAIRRFGLAPLKENFLCTMTVFRNRKPEGYLDPVKGKLSHTLTALCEAYDVPRQNAHRALADVLMTAEALQRLERQGPLDHYINLIGWDRRFGKPSWTPPHGILRRQDVKTSNGHVQIQRSLL